jgi:hypothetical protein
MPLNDVVNRHPVPEHLDHLDRLVLAFAHRVC